MPNYHITVNDRAGEFDAADAADWPACLQRVRAFAKEHPKAVICVYDMNQIDAGTDGLTEDEREEVQRAITEAHPRDYRGEVYKRAAGTEAGGIDPWTAELETQSSVESWAKCIALLRVMARAYPNHIVTASNQALAELDTDGLTDQERDDVVRAIAQARAELEAQHV